MMDPAIKGLVGETDRTAISQLESVGHRDMTLIAFGLLVPRCRNLSAGDSPRR